MSVDVWVSIETSLKLVNSSVLILTKFSKCKSKSNTEYVTVMYVNPFWALCCRDILENKCYW